MPKLILITKRKHRTEWLVQDKEMLIGRGSDCAVRLDAPSVSRHHAKVVKILTGYCVEDLRSTNGVILNGRRVRKHILLDGNIVQIGNHKLRFVADSGEDAADSEEAVPPSPETSQRRRLVTPPSARADHAYVRFLSGPEQGNSKLVDRSLFTIGKPGGSLAVISRRVQGHFLMHLGGDIVTTRNGEPVHGAGVELDSGDVVQVGNTRLEFHNEP